MEHEVFAVKKFISLFLSPLPLFFMVALVGLYFLWFSKKQKLGKSIITISLLFLYVCCYQPFADKLLWDLEAQYPPYSSDSGNVEFVIVLGSSHTTIPGRSAFSTLSHSAKARLSEGIRVYKLNPGSKMIVSGYSGGDVRTQAQALFDAAVELGISKDDIIIEPRPMDTKDEAFLIKDIVNGKRAALVTSAYHMKRSHELFKGQGVDVVCAPAGFFADRSSFGLKALVPRSDTLLKHELSIHEYVGLVWAKIMGQI